MLDKHNYHGQELSNYPTKLYGAIRISIDPFFAAAPDKFIGYANSIGTGRGGFPVCWIKQFNYIEVQIRWKRIERDISPCVVYFGQPHLCCYLKGKEGSGVGLITFGTRWKHQVPYSSLSTLILIPWHSRNFQHYHVRRKDDNSARARRINYFG